MCIYIYIYIYIERERERERDNEKKNEIVKPLFLFEKFSNLVYVCENKLFEYIISMCWHKQRIKYHSDYSIPLNCHHSYYSIPLMSNVM